MKKILFFKYVLKRRAPYVSQTQEFIQSSKTVFSIQLFLTLVTAVISSDSVKVNHSTLT